MFHFFSRLHLWDLGTALAPESSVKGSGDKSVFSRHLSVFTLSTCETPGNVLRIGSIVCMATEIQEWPKVTVWIPKRWHSESRCLSGAGYDEAPDPCGDLSKAFSGSDSGSWRQRKRTERRWGWFSVPPFYPPCRP